MEMSDRTKERDVQHAEYKFFYTYFSYLGSFMCDKAKEFAEKERATFLPANLQVALVHLAQHEKVYFSLSFLEQKSWFARRDSLKNSYSTLQSMFLSTEKQELKINLVETESNVEQESLISAICLQLSDFCAARLECLSLYIQMYKSTLSSPLHTLCSEVEVLLESYPAKISHDCLKRIQDCVTEELTVLLALLQAGQKISEWNYTGALYDMDEAHEVLVRWKPLVMNHQGSTFRGSFFSFGEKSSTPASGLYLWMEKFFQTLKSRFTFYFYE
uniref:Uncharacterized protein n=1 Tax=Ciona savignyi TaxID=51511 RepID=H2ZHV8_CIOSA